MPSRFVPTLQLPDDWAGAVTVVVREGQVEVLDEHADEVAPGAPSMVLGTFDGAACWAIDLDGDGTPDVELPAAADPGIMPLMGTNGTRQHLARTLAGRSAQLRAGPVDQREEKESDKR